MKPFAGDYLVQPFIKIAEKTKKHPEISFTQAALRYVINSGINAESTLVGMYNLPQLYENVAAYYTPEMSDEEHGLLNKIKQEVTRTAQAMLPDHYKWLETWAPNRLGKATNYPA